MSQYTANPLDMDSLYNFGIAYAGMPPIQPYGHKEEVPIGYDGFGALGSNM
jgi:hypothetical protein